MTQLGRIPALAVIVSALALVAPTPAFGDGDPVAHGTFQLVLSRSFGVQLKRNQVTMKPAVFSVKSGSLNPISGTGSLTMKGRLTFKHGRDKVVYDTVTARLGPGGVLKAKGVKLFSLSRGAVSRNGFGAELSGVRARFRKDAAMKIRKKLGLRSLHAGGAGRALVSEQPQTVAVTGGDVHLVPDPNLASGAGNIASKLGAHCINGLSGVSAIAPGVKNPPALTPSFDFPVTGGTISPAGTDGVVNQAGGIQLANTHSGGGCNSVTLATIQQTNFANNMLRNYISAQVVITGPPAPLGGDQGTKIGSNLNTTNSTVSADPGAHTVTVNGTVVRFNKASALVLNQAFPQPLSSYDPSMDFAAGDLFGTVDLTVTTR